MRRFIVYNSMHFKLYCWDNFYDLLLDYLYDPCLPLSFFLFARNKELREKTDKDRNEIAAKLRTNRSAKAYLTSEFGDVLATLADYRTGNL